MRFERFVQRDLENSRIGRAQIYGNIVVIYGRNESGKSTLFNMVDTLLYGWSPATAKIIPMFHGIVVIQCKRRNSYG